MLLRSAKNGKTSLKCPFKEGGIKGLDKGGSEGENVGC
jgi:hypothetical protein